MNYNAENARYIGVDVGEGSVGWAVTDAEYHLCRAHGKDMWGTRLFEEAKASQERRQARNARRRLQRRNQRLAYLQEIFAEAIDAIDPRFFQRLSKARLFPEEKDCKYTLFDDEDFTDRMYHRRYPTIFHLRYALMQNQGTDDPRLVYLALHHILKKRGHFLAADTPDRKPPNFETLLENCSLAFEDELQLTLRCEQPAQLKEVLLDAHMKSNVKQKKLLELFSVASTETKAQKDQQTAWLKLLSGANAELSVLFDDPVLKADTHHTVNFAKAAIEDELPAYEALLGERMYLLECWRSLYNWAILQRLLGDHSSLSAAKIAQYTQNAEDLAALKHVLRQYGTREQYVNIFQSPDAKDSYSNLVGHTRVDGKKVSVKRCSHEDFCKAIKAVLDKLPEVEGVVALKQKAKNQTLLPRLISRDNTIIPYQLHQAELEVILTNAARKLPFLNERDAEGLTAVDKIRALMVYRIPYYVGPLNSHSPNAWAVRREVGKITPWNFEQKIDLLASAQQFINRMTGNCTYLREYGVLPSCSPRYERFTALNEINPITLNGEPISVEMKQYLFEQVFLRYKKPTAKTLLRALEARGISIKRDDIGGIDLEGGIKSSLRTEIQLREVLGTRYTPELAEAIVEALTTLGDDRSLLRQKLRSFPQIADDKETIDRLTRIRCTGWGRLSAELLESIRADVDGHAQLNIMEALWETNHTFGGLLAETYAFKAAIDRRNAELNEQDEEDFIDELYVSAAVRRQIRQTLAVVKELRKIIGHDPEKLFIEMARGTLQEPKRTVSRKQKLMELYAHCKDVDRALADQLEAATDQDLRRNQLYLYFTQMGKCIYTNESISLTDLYTTKTYDIDHIYPRSIVKDDSLDNLVLANAVFNRYQKGNNYPVSADIQNQQRAFWHFLLERQLISKVKYDRLIRQTPFTEEEKIAFINRQLVETRQATKAVATLLKRLLPGTDIVYVKAHNVSDFRQKFEFPKVRELNDLHHAKDAYLSIVVGNVYDTKFTRSAAHFIRDVREHYHMNKMYDYDVKRGTTVAWLTGDDGTIQTVRQTMRRNSVLVTQMTYKRSGLIANLQPLMRPNGQLPLKKDLPIEKYGGYDNAIGTCFMLVEYDNKKKERVRSLIDVPIHLSNQLLQNNKAALSYCQNTLGLQAPRIIIPIIRINSLLSINGFRAYLSNKASRGKQLKMDNAHQLMLDAEMEAYLKRLLKYIRRAQEYERMHKGECYCIVAADGIAPDMNLDLYDLFLRKLSQPPYAKRPNNQYDFLQEKRERFITLSCEQQCFVLCQILNLFTRAGKTADLTAIGGSRHAGALLISNQIRNDSKAFIIHQSVTGLFPDQKVDLLR